MANDKDFILKNAVEVGGPTKVTVGTVTSNNVDLSTGNYFVDTPSGVSTYTFSNPADVQAFQLEVTGGTAEVAQNFSTTLYTGNGATQTITNGIDLANDGGLVWVKNRTSASYDHYIVDSETGNLSFALASNSTRGKTFDFSPYSFISALNSDGFSIGNGGGDLGDLNASGNNYVSWTFKKAAGFFDIVTYTGDGVAGRTVSHNLGADVGTLIVKKTSGVDNWFVWHRGLTDATYRIILNLTSGEQQQTNAWNSTAPTSTEFTLGDNANVNENGASYVAYLFAHDVAADGLIQCGSFTTNGSGSATVNLGWEPQFAIIKGTSVASQWVLLDSARGWVNGSSDNWLRANAADAEQSNDLGHPTATGFEVANFASGNYIYIAIRAASDPDITWPASVQWSGGTAPQSPAVGEKDVYTFVTDDGGTSYVGIQSADNIS